MKQFFSINEYSFFKLIWIIILLPKELQFIYIMFIALKLNKNISKKIDFTGTIIIIYSLVHIFSIYININLYSFNISRILAALNSALIWIIAFLMYMYYKNNKVDITKISKYCFFNMVILILISLISLIMFNVLKFNKFNVGSLYLFTTDWFMGKPQLRFAGFFNYSNLVTLFYVIFFPISLIYVGKNKKNIITVSYIILSIIPIFISLSRSGFVIIIISYILTLIYFLYNKLDRRLFIIAIIFILISIIILLVYYNGLSNLRNSILELINGREGSNGTRSYIYEESINITTLYSPIWGLGVKAISNTGYPLGSHSTYIGFYYKAGIIGLVFGSLALVLVTLRLIFSRVKSLNYKMISIFLIIVIFMLIFEDIDGENWLVVSYFILVGCMLNYKNWINYGIKRLY